MQPKSIPYFWSRFGLSLFFGIAALFWLAFDQRSGWLLCAVTLGVFVLTVVLSPIRHKSGIIHPLITAPILLFASIALVETALPRRCSYDSVAHDIAPIILQLDAYKAAHGRYPATLDAAGIKPPVYRGGGAFNYGVDADGSCGLSVGDYLLDNFAASWHSESREWSFDT